MRTPILAAVFLFILSHTTFAGKFIPLGDLPGGELMSRAYGVSDDGSVVTGPSDSEETVWEAFRWTAETGMVGLGVTGTFSGDRISGDGTTIVGGTSGTGTWIYTQSEGLKELPLDQANSVSFDGSIVVGYMENMGAVSWTQENGVTSIVYKNSRAGAVSADGSVIAGRSWQEDNEVFHWTDQTGMVGIGDLAGGEYFSTSYGMSSDGSFIVGVSESHLGAQAFRWSKETGMVGIEPLFGADQELFGLGSRAYAVTDNGNTVVGVNVVSRDLWSDPKHDFNAYIWTAEHGTRNLQQVLSDEYGLADSLTGWELRSAEEITPDGRFIVGSAWNPEGNIEGWLIDLAPVPEPSTWILLATGGLLLLVMRYRQR